MAAEVSYAAMIRLNYGLLCSYRADGREPSQELLDDIKAYECILDQPGAEAQEARARQYAEGTHQGMALSGVRPRPRQVARALGWMP